MSSIAYSPVIPVSRETAQAARRTASANASRARREAKEREYEAKGKVVLKRIGGYKAFHVGGERKAGVATFMKRRLLLPLPVFQPNNAITIRPICPPVQPVIAVERVSDSEMGAINGYQKGLRGFRKGKYIHRQISRMVKVGMFPNGSSRKGNKGARGRTKKEGKKRVGTKVHPQVKAVCQLLNNNGYIPLDVDVGVHIGHWATEIDLVCYKRGCPKNEVTIFELKTGYDHLRDYLRLQYRLCVTLASSSNTIYGVSERDKAMLQLMLTTIQASETFRGKWKIQDAMLISSHPDRAELTRLPDEILTLRKVLETKLHRER